MSVAFHHGDGPEVQGMAANSVDACVTDPPYALVSTVKRLGNAGSAPVADAAGTRIVSDLPAGPFSCILADPPWHHASRSPKGQTSRSPSHHYATMTLADICALPVREAAAKNTHLFLWTTWPHLPQALKIIDAWGFKYSSGFLTWVKLNPGAASTIWLTESDLHVGMGYTSRKNSELLLLGRRGSPRRLSKGIREIMLAARREHSRKPDEARARIEAYCDGPRLELFARESAPGWTAWGLEASKFDQTRAA